MTLHEAATTLRGSLRDGALCLDRSSPALTGLPTVLGLLEADSLVLAPGPAGISESDSRVEVDGQATLLGTAAQVKLRLEAGESGALECSLTARFPSLSLPALVQHRLIPTAKLDTSLLPDVAFTGVQLSAASSTGVLSLGAEPSSHAWTVLEAASLSLEELGFALTRSASAATESPAVALRLNGTLELGSTRVPVRLELPTNPQCLANQWELFLGEGEPITAGLEDLAQLLMGASVSASLPPGLSEAASFSLDRLELGFNPVKATIYSVALGLSTAEPCSLIEGALSLEEVGLHLRVLEPLGRRRFSTEVFGTVQLGSTSRVSISMIVPPTSGSWYVGLRKPLQLPSLSELSTLPGGLELASLGLPEGLSGLGSLWVTRFELNFNPKQRTVPRLAMGLAFESTWEIFPGLSLSSPRLALELTQPFNSAQRAVAGSLSGKVTIAGLTLKLEGGRATPQSPWMMSAALPAGESLQLSALAAELLEGVALPDELPDLALSDLAVSVAPATGEFTFKGTCSASWELPFGVPGLAVASTTVQISRGPAPSPGVKGPLSCSITLSGTGPVTLADGLTFDRFSLTFELDGKGGWSLGGSIAAGLYGVACSLSAELEQTPTQRTIALATTLASAEPLLDFGIGSMSAERFSIRITKALQSSGTTEGTRLATSSAYTWDVSVTASLVVQEAFTLAGTLRLFKTDSSSGLVFEARDAHVELPLPVPGYSIKTYLGVKSLSILSTTDSMGRAARTLDGTIQVWFTGLPETFQEVLAQRTTGRFRMEPGRTLISVDRLTQPVELDLSDMHIGLGETPLGIMAFDASNLALQLGSSLALSMDFGLGLPVGLNAMFGTKDDGTASVQFFNTYQPGIAASISRFRLGVDATTGVTIQCLTSPLKSVRLTVEGQNSWFYADLGDFGEVRCLVPVFSFDGVNFTARGGFQQVRPLQVPLAPLKLLLEACKLESLSQALPAGLPLQELNVVDEDGHLRIEEFFSALERLGGFSLPSELRDTLRLMEDRFDALPERFRSYLRIEIPDGFQFDISVTTDGGARGKVWVKGDKPIKLLYPTWGLLGPMLTGIELYSLTFGEVLSGALLLLNVDVRVDEFDLMMLAAALALPLDQLPLAPSTRAMGRRYIVQDLFMLIVYETGLPIPVPLFFGELGFETMGLEGLEFQTHWRFPAPKVNSADASAIFNGFKRFFTERDYLLDASHPPEDLDLKLTLGPNFLQLPPYLGGKVLGDREATVTLSVYSGLAHLMNAMKTLSLDELIQAVPLDMRVGSEEVSFAFMKLRAAWLLTTPKEFREVGYQRLQVVDSDIERTLRVLPTSGKPPEGLVLFLRGGWALAGVVSLDTCFGLVAAGSGVGTGLTISGRLADVLDAELSGTVVIDPEGQEVFSLTGHSHLALLGDPIFTGDLRLSERRFELSGALDLFPRSPALRITGKLAGRLSETEFLVSGSAAVSLGTWFTLAAASVELSHTGARVSGTWLNQTMTFAVQRMDSGVQLEASLSPVSWGDAFRITEVGGKSGPRAVITVGTNPRLFLSGAAYLLGISAQVQVDFSEEGLAFEARGKLFELFEATVMVKGRDLLDGNSLQLRATMHNDLLAYLKEHASAALQAGADSAMRELSEAQRQVDAAERSLKAIDQQLSEMRRTIEEERKRDTQRIDAAQKKVEAASDSVKGLDKQINQTRKELEREREEATRALTKAQASVEGAKSELKSINKKIKKTKEWWDDLPDVDWPHKPSKTRDSAEYAAKMAGLYSAREAAELALKAAEKTLEGLEKGVDLVPIEADPRLVGLYASRETALAALKVAEEALKAAKEAAAAFPINADPRMLGLYASKETAKGSCEAARKVLDGVKRSVGAMADVGAFILDKGLGALLDVRAATFEASLQAAQGGHVSLETDLVFMGKRKRMQLAFDFHSSLESARALADRLVPTK